MFPAGDEVAQPAVPAGLTLAPIGRRMIGLILDQILVAFPVVLVVIGVTTGTIATSCCPIERTPVSPIRSARSPMHP